MVYYVYYDFSLQTLKCCRFSNMKNIENLKNKKFKKGCTVYLLIPSRSDFSFFSLLGQYNDYN